MVAEPSAPAELYTGGRRAMLLFAGVILALGLVALTIWLLAGAIR